jgi:DNA modification methylase
MDAVEKIPTMRKSKKITISKEAIEQNISLINSVHEGLKVNKLNGFANLVNYAPLSDQPIHRWFRYREGYSIELVKELIKDLPKGSIILDPFCGAGSTLIAAQELGYDSIGFDINPMSTLISEVKTQSYSLSDVEEIKKHLANIQELTALSPVEDKPALSIIDKVFNREILRTLLSIRFYFNRIENSKHHKFLKVGWLAILESVSNVFKEGNGIKYRNRKRTPNGYVNIPIDEWQESYFPENKLAFVMGAFSDKVLIMLSDIEGRNTDSSKTTIINDSAENITRHIESNSITYVVFSPPYCNCFNYFKIFKVELWMGQFVNSYQDMKKLNRGGLRSHVETPLFKDTDYPLPVVDRFVNQINPEMVWDKRIPQAVNGYFQDMRTVLKGIESVLKPSGNCSIVVGNSAYAGVLIPTDALLTKIGVDNGLESVKISVARHLTTSSQQKNLLGDRKDFLRESIVELKKPDPRLTDINVITVDEIPMNVTHGKDSIFVIKNSGLTAYTHKFHRYPGKFIPHVPRWAINKYLKEGRGSVFDPFCGSGTTLVEGRLLGHDTFGFDIDPIARLVTKVKSTPLDKITLLAEVESLKLKVETRNERGYVPDLPTLSHWFNDKAVSDLSVIRTAIEEHSSNQDIYDFFLLCFTAIIRKASNADNQTQKTYVSNTLIKTPEPAKPLFVKILDDYTKRILEFSKLVNTENTSFVFGEGDARQASVWAKKNGKEKFDLAVTSPPYVNSVDYVYNQMAEYFWIGDRYEMENQPKQNIHKKLYIGTDKVTVKEYANRHEIGISAIDSLTNRIYEKNKKNSYVVHKYFADMLQHFNEVKQVLKKDAHYVVVIGDSIVNNEVILTHELLQDCASMAGFELTNVFGYEIRNRHMRFPRQGRGGIIKYDWILDFVAK